MQRTTYTMLLLACSAPAASAQFTADCGSVSLLTTPVKIDYEVGTDTAASKKALQFTVVFPVGSWAAIGFKAAGSTTMSGLDIIAFDSANLDVKDASATGNAQPTIGAGTTTFVSMTTAGGLSTMKFYRRLDEGSGFTIPTFTQFIIAWATNTGTVAAWTQHTGSNRALLTTSVSVCTPAPATPAPLTAAPLTPAPLTRSPNTPAPATPAPNTNVPPTAAPATPAPATAQPTSAPLAYIFGRVFLITLNTGYDVFSVSEFGTKVLGIVDRLRVKSVVVESVCPVAVCPSRVCPATTKERADAGCKLGGIVTTASRTSTSLQTSTPYYVSFDVVPTDSYSKNTARSSAYTSISNNVNGANTLPYQASQVDLVNPGVDNTSKTASSDDDDGINWWLIMLICCAALLCVCIIIGILILMKRAKGGEGGGKNEKKSEPGPYKQEQQQQQPQRSVQQRQHRPIPAEDGPIAGRLGGNNSPHQAQQPQQPAMYRPAPSPSPAREMQPYQSNPKPPPSPVYSQPDTGYNSAFPYNSFTPGQKVSVEYGQEWFPAEIVSQQPEGTYTINWEDGTHSKDIAPDSVRVAY